MATFDYEEIRDEIVEPALDEFGYTDATLTQPGPTTGPDYDPTPGTPTVYPVSVLNVGFSFSESSSGLVREDDLKFMMSTKDDPDPDLKGTLTVDAVTYQVVKITPKSPGPTVLFWYVHCRK